MFTGRKSGLMLAFTVLLALAFGVSCTGFFPPNTLTAVTIQPPTPQIEVGAANAQTLQAWGTYQDGSRAQITSGVQWTSNPGSVLTIGPTSGLATGVSSGSATVTAAAQGLSTTASATVFLGNISGFAVCLGTFGSTSCSNGSTPLTWPVNVTLNQVNGTFVAQGVSSGKTLDLTTASTWTVESSISSSISCDSSVTPASCTVAEGTTANTYVITVTYGSGTSASTATISVVVTG
jgi:trimeric autotransporter adhesin